MSLFSGHYETFTDIQASQIYSDFDAEFTYGLINSHTNKLDAKTQNDQFLRGLIGNKIKYNQNLLEQFNVDMTSSIEIKTIDRYAVSAFIPADDTVYSVAISYPTRKDILDHVLTTNIDSYSNDTITDINSNVFNLLDYSYIADSNMHTVAFYMESPDNLVRSTLPYSNVAIVSALDPVPVVVNTNSTLDFTAMSYVYNDFDITYEYTIVNIYEDTYEGNIVTNITLVDSGVDNSDPTISSVSTSSESGVLDSNGNGVITRTEVIVATKSKTISNLQAVVATYKFNGDEITARVSRKVIVEKRVQVTSVANIIDGPDSIAVATEFRDVPYIRGTSIKTTSSVYSVSYSVNASFQDNFESVLDGLSSVSIQDVYYWDVVTGTKTAVDNQYLTNYLLANTDNTEISKLIGAMDYLVIRTNKGKTYLINMDDITINILTTVKESVYPLIPLKSGGEIIVDNEDYKMYLSKLNMRIEDFTTSLEDSLIRYSALTYTQPLKTTTDLETKYVFDFLFAAFFKYDDVNIAPEVYIPGTSLSSLIDSTNVITVNTDNVNISSRFNVSINYVDGTISTLYDFTEGTPVNFKSTGMTYTQNMEVASILGLGEGDYYYRYRYQAGSNFYVELKVHAAYTVYSINGLQTLKSLSEYGIASGANELVVLPIVHSQVNTMTMKDRLNFISRNSRILVEVVQTVYVKWYQTMIFQFILNAALMVIAATGQAWALTILISNTATTIASGIDKTFGVVVGVATALIGGWESFIAKGATTTTKVMVTANALLSTVKGAQTLLLMRKEKKLKSGLAELTTELDELEKENEEDEVGGTQGYFVPFSYNPYNRIDNYYKIAVGGAAYNTSILYDIDSIYYPNKTYDAYQT